MSLRWKLTLWYVATVTLILAAFVGADVLGLSRNLHAKVDQTLHAGSDRLVRDLKRVNNPSDPSTLEEMVRYAFPDRTAYVQLDPQDFVGSPNAAVVSASLGDRRFAQSSRNEYESSPWTTTTLANLSGELRVFGCPAHDASGRPWWVRSAISNGDVAESLREALWEHGLLAAITILGVALVGHLILRRAFRPVREMALLAKTITAEDLSGRIQTTSRDEIGQLGDTLNDMIARLERSFLHMGQFATVVAHELNTPLTTLKGELELIRRRDRSAQEYRALIPRLQTQIERLSTLVDNLLLLSRMESQSTAFQLSAEQLDQVVLEVYEEYEALAREANVAIRVEVPACATVQGERALMKQLVSNLVANAIRYTDAEGEVSVCVTTGEAGVQLRVTDTGRGIPAEALPHVCEPFYRADAIHSSATGGVGLGLAIVRRVGDLHGCTLRFESTIGKGTTVTVSWPPSDFAKSATEAAGAQQTADSATS